MQVSAVDAIRRKMVKGRNGEALDYKKYLGCSSVDLNLRAVLIRSNDGKLIKDDDGRTLPGVTISIHSKIMPQETVYIISEEIIHVPPGYIAYVFLKNRFSQKGLLAFNTGIVDGGFEGPISTLLTNISAQELDLKNVNEGKFFRVVFHQIDMEKNDLRSVRQISYAFDKYLIFKAEELLSLPRYFQNPDKIKKQIEDSLSSKALNIGFVKIGVIVGIAGFLMVLAPPLTQLVTSKLFSTEPINKGVWESKNQEYEERLKSIEFELNNLKHQANTLPSDSSTFKQTDDAK
tara:strand:+ start:956 stop:1825 length:870 start_codon:yes stop_codon:yes gene_type:complete